MYRTADAAQGTEVVLNLMDHYLSEAMDDRGSLVQSSYMVSGPWKFQWSGSKMPISSLLDASL